MQQNILPSEKKIEQPGIKKFEEAVIFDVRKKEICAGAALLSL